MNLEKLKQLTGQAESELAKSDSALIEDIPSFVWIDSFISAAGSYYYEREKGRKPSDVDVIVRADGEGHEFKITLGPDLRLKLDRILKARTGLPSTHWHNEPHGPDWRYQPLYDLALVPRKKMEIREINEEKFADEFYKERISKVLLDEFTEEISDKDFMKLHLAEFRSRGTDDDIVNAKSRWRVLLAGLRYLGNSAYPKLQEGKEWGDFTKTDVFKYFAKIVDALRGIYFPISPPKIGEKGFESSYWQCYRASRKYQKSSPPSESELAEWNRRRKEIIKIIEKHVQIIEKKEDEHIVCGIVYEPDVTDAQGDSASAEEIKKAAYHFMENVQAYGDSHIKNTIKWAFSKKPILKVLENYLAPCNLTIAGQHIKKGTWILTSRVIDKDIWRRIKSGEITGYSMAGHCITG